MSSDEADEVKKTLFDSLENRYQNNLELMRGSEFVFDYVQLLYYKCHKVNFSGCGSYIDSPDQIKIKKINNNRFQHAVTVGLNYEVIKKDPQSLYN